MEDRDYRSEVGKKIEEALANGDFDLIEDLIEVPPMETFMQWAEKGEEKRKKRVCRKKILVSCLAIVVVSASVLIGLKCFALPEVTADPDTGIDIELNDMESVVTYRSWDALPDEIKEQFIEVKGLPKEYEIKCIKVHKKEFATKIGIEIKGENYLFEIRQFINNDGSLPTSSVPQNNEKITLNGVVTYVEELNDYQMKSYKYMVGKITIDFVVPKEMEINTVENLARTVQ